ncbi:hypothetical protein [Bradyrhizobium sp. JYMT SZCCT0428]|uniref:hypothetical protein n=1 Tax=Bradyrhizobium sp. JYMT SZCCT0428 TaxID=2807673 RepID=UPI001BAC17C0|nr:hypothetical protein [Bradyrhizobium sp. JYMT SZCCT0428]MBR1153707.1 hypothetical protein [Bradyrhizobium sp. JYMT SZCCT0428]
MKALTGLGIDFVQGGTSTAVAKFGCHRLAATSSVAPSHGGGTPPLATEQQAAVIDDFLDLDDEIDEALDRRRNRSAGRCRRQRRDSWSPRRCCRFALAQQHVEPSSAPQDIVARTGIAVAVTSGGN